MPFNICQDIFYTETSHSFSLLCTVCFYSEKRLKSLADSLTKVCICLLVEVDLNWVTVGLKFSLCCY